MTAQCFFLSVAQEGGQDVCEWYEEAVQQNYSGKAPLIAISDGVICHG